MALMYSDSPEGLSSTLMIFDLPATEMGINKIQDVEYRPISQISNNSPIEYNIPPSGSFYKDLRRMTQKIKFQILKDDGSVIDDNDKVGCINQILQTMWKQVEVYFEGQLMTSSDTNYPYRAIFRTLLENGVDSKMSQLQSQLFYKDTAGAMDDNGTGANTGLFARSSFTNGSSIVQLEGPLMTDLNYLDRLILNGIRIGIKFIPNTDSFNLISSTSETTKYKINIIDHSIIVPHIIPSGAVLINHDKMLQNTNAKYPMRRTEVRSLSIPQGTSNVNELIFQDQLPSRIILGFVKSLAYNGSYTTNPFNFLHCNINFLRVSVNGDSVNGHPIQLKFSGDKDYEFTESYLNLFQGTGKFQKDFGNNIQLVEYNNGYSIFVVDIDGTHSMNQSHSLMPDTRGILRVEAKFDTPLPESINIIAYGEFQTVFEINRARNILLDR